MKKFRILFMGTTPFSQAILQTLLTTLKAEIEVVALVCPPDSKIGRKQMVMPVAIKQFALANNIMVLQPIKIIDSYMQLQQLNIDIIITCAYGQFLPSLILKLPKYKCLNIHASLLPALRGGAPIQWAIIKGLKTTGITLMEMISKMDAGPIFVQAAVKINDDDTYSSLVNKLIICAEELLVANLLKIITNQIIAQPQDETKVSFGLNIQRNDEKIDWNKSADLVSCHVRGLYDHPIAYTILNNGIYKVHQVVLTNELSTKKAGTIVNINKLGIIVATTTYDLIIKVLQPAGKKPIITACYFGSKPKPLQIGDKFD